MVLGAPSETTSFHLIIEKPRCVLLGSIDAPHTAGILVGARRRVGLQQRGIFSFWTFDAPHTAGILVGARRRVGLQQRGIFSFWMRVGSTVTERISVRWRQCSVVRRRGSPTQGAEDVPGELCRRALRTCPGSTAGSGGAESRQWLAACGGRDLCCCATQLCR